MNDVTRGEQYRRMIESIDQLPSLPSIVTRLVQVVNSPDTSAEDAAGVIEKDPALTSKMLRLANSAFYGIPRTISSVSSAVVILGFNTIKSLVLSASVVRMFPSGGGKGDTFDRRRFWKHSIVCGLAARSITRALMSVKMMDPESSFCAGILHDIGKLVFEQYMHEEYVGTCSHAADKGIAMVKAESEVLGITHTEVGRMLADKWALPSELEASIVSHHNPSGGGKVAELVTTVHLANRIAHSVGAGLWDGEAVSEEWDKARALLKIDDAAYERILGTVTRDLETSDEFFTIISAS